MFLDDDNNIDRDSLDMLESEAIDYVRNHGSYETDNSATPNPRRNPYKEQRVKRLHSSILFRMEALGYDLNRTYNGPVDAALFIQEMIMQGYDKTTGKFIVLAGSDIALDIPIIKNQRAIATRLNLFGESTARAVLEEDISFPSPSAAAVFVFGR